MLLWILLQSSWAQPGLVEASDEFREIRAAGSEGPRHGVADLLDPLVLVHLELPLQVRDGDPESEKPVEHRRKTVTDLVEPPGPNPALLQSADKVGKVTRGDRSLDGLE